MTNGTTAWRDAVASVKSDPNYSTVFRASNGWPELPELLLAIGAESMIHYAHDYLEEVISNGGKLEGRAKGKPADEDLLEETVDKQIEYIRPNGDIYFARPYGSEKNAPLDIEVCIRGRNKRMPIFMYGPPGTGKTALVEAAFGEDLITVVLTGDTDELALIGQFVPDPVSEYRWVDGPLLRAVKEGKPILLDEIGVADPKVLTILYGLMDGRAELVVTLNPEIGVVKAADGFYIIGATNPNAPGVNLSEALLSRFPIHVEVTTDFKLAELKLGVQEEIVNVARNLNSRVEMRELDWAPQMRELLAFRDVKEEFGEVFAVQNLIAAAPVEARDILKQALANLYGHPVAIEARI